MIKLWIFSFMCIALFNFSPISADTYSLSTNLTEASGNWKVYDMYNIDDDFNLDEPEAYVTLVDINEDLAITFAHESRHYNYTTYLFVRLNGTSVLASPELPFTAYPNQSWRLTDFKEKSYMVWINVENVANLMNEQSVILWVYQGYEEDEETIDLETLKNLMSKVSYRIRILNLVLKLNLNK